jgi:hypothetical protein
VSAADDRYNHSDKGRARHRRYNSSLKGGLRSSRYERTAKAMRRKLNWEIANRSMSPEYVALNERFIAEQEEGDKVRAEYGDEAYSAWLDEQIRQEIANNPLVAGFVAFLQSEEGVT